MKTTAHPELLATFMRWWHQNVKGGWGVKWRRRSVWGAQIIQKMGLHKEVSAPLFWGESMQVIAGENVSSGILTFGYTEAALTALMLHVLKPGQHIVDVGTHFGYVSLLGCRLVGPRGVVTGFEPSPPSFALAQQNLESYSIASLHACAVSDEKGMLSLERRPIEESAFNRIVEESSSQSLDEVSVVTLDEALTNLPPVDFLELVFKGTC